MRNHKYIYQYERTEELRDKIRTTLRYKWDNGLLCDSEETRRKKGHPGKSNPHYGKRYKNCCRPVIQYDLEGNYIREYECVTDAAKEIGRDGSGIICCCRGVQKTVGGYIFKYKEDKK